VPQYILAQILGACVGAGLVYANYFKAIDLFEGHGIRTIKTASLFTTYAVRLRLFTFIYLLCGETATDLLTVYDNS